MLPIVPDTGQTDEDNPLATELFVLFAHNS